jgi:glycerol-3-phosphate acyltransferase PlsY
MMPLVSLIIFAVWGVVLKLSRYVSLASIVAALSLPIAVVVLLMFGPSQGWAAVHGWGNFYFGVAAALMVFKRHTANIKRLIAGTELRFGDPKPAENATESTPSSPEPPPVPPASLS